MGPLGLYVHGVIVHGGWISSIKGGIKRSIEVYQAVDVVE